MLPLAIVGLAISSYFTAVAYRWVQPDARWVPPVCRLGPETCAMVVFTPQARIFGVPNSVLGQVYYVAILVGGISGWLWQAPFHSAALAASALTVVLAAYLSYSLLFVLRVRCVLCFASHGINVGLFLVLV